MNIKRIIREELEGFKDSSEGDWEWAKEEIIPIGSCITTHIIGTNDKPLDLDYVVMGDDGDKLTIRPKPYPNEERFYKTINKDKTMNGLYNGNITFCHS